MGSLRDFIALLTTLLVTFSAVSQVVASPDVAPLIEIFRTYLYRIPAVIIKVTKLLVSES